MGLGEVSRPEIEQWIARVFFFHYTEQLEQKKLRELYNSCRTAFDQLRVEGRRVLPELRSDFPCVVISTQNDRGETSRVHDIFTWQDLLVAAPHFPSAEELRNAVLTWAEKYNLATPWILDAVWRLVGVWCQTPAEKPLLEWALPSLDSINADGGRETVGLGFGGISRYRPHNMPPGLCAEIPKLPPYDPVAMTRHEYLTKIHGIAEGYCTEQEAAHKTLGFKPTTAKRGRTDSQWVHFKWLVQYQIGRMTSRQIAEKHKGGALDESAVSAAVRQAARLIDLPLRGQDSKSRNRR